MDDGKIDIRSGSFTHLERRDGDPEWSRCALDRRHESAAHRLRAAIQTIPNIILVPSLPRDVARLLSLLKRIMKLERDSPPTPCRTV